MAFGMLANNGHPIAVDFGVGSLKALQISGGERQSLVAAAAIRTPEELVADAPSRFQFQLDSLPTLLRSAPFRGRRAICSIPASQTHVQHMKIPRTEGVSLNSLISGELTAALHCQPGQIVIRHVEVDELSTGPKREVICFAITRKVVHDVIQALRGCRLETVGMHSEHLALVRAIAPTAGARVMQRRAAMGDEDQDRKPAVMFVDIGLGTTKVAVAHADAPVFAKTVDVAGLSLDQAIARQLKCSVSEAHTRRAAHGDLFTNEPAPAPALAHAGGGGDAPAPDAGEGTVIADLGGRTVDLTEPVEALADEVAMCARYHAKLFPETPVDSVVFTGGESRSIGLCRRIAQSLRAPASVADPFTTLEKNGTNRCKNVDLASPQPAWSATYGLTLCPADL